MTNKVTVNLNMLSALAKDRILNNLDRTLIVTVEQRCRERDTYVKQNMMELDNLNNNINYRMIFGLDYGTNNFILFLALSIYKQGTKKNTKVNSRTLINRIMVQIKIR